MVTTVLIVLLILALLEIVLLNGAAAVRIHPPDEFSLVAKQKPQRTFSYVEVFWWARVDVASRASKKAPQGLFSPPDCSAGRCCSNPPA